MEQIDWGKELPAATPPPSTSGIDWDKELNQTPQASISALPGQFDPGGHSRPDRPIRNWFEDLGNDIEHGSTLTLPGTLLHKLGAQGLSSGVSPGTAQAMESITPLGLLKGPGEAAHGVLNLLAPDSSSSERVKGANEAIGGAGKMLGGALPLAAPAALPHIVPTLAAYGAANKGIKSAAESGGANPDNAQLISNLATLAIPAAKGAAAPVGKFMENNAGKIVNAGAVASGIAGMAKGRLPVEFLGGSDISHKVLDPTIQAAGRGLQAVGNARLLPHEIMNTPPVASGPIQTPSSPFSNGYNFIGQKKGPEVEPEPEIVPPEPRQLGKGAIITPPPAPEPEGPMARPAASVVVRGKGGRMTKQFVTSVDDNNGKARVNPGQIAGNPELPPEAPPNAPQTESILPSQFQGPAQPPNTFNASGENLPPQSTSPLPEMSPEAEAVSKKAAEAKQQEPAQSSDNLVDLLQKSIDNLKAQQQQQQPAKRPWQTPSINITNLEDAQGLGSPDKRGLIEKLTDFLSGKKNTETPQPLTNGPGDNIIDTRGNMPVDESRRNFLKLGAKGLAASALPKGALGKLIDTAMPEAPLGMNLPKMGASALWKHLDLGGDDDVDYNSSYVDNGLDLIRKYMEAKGIANKSGPITIPTSDLDPYVDKDYGLFSTLGDDESYGSEYTPGSEAETSFGSVSPKVEEYLKGNGLSVSNGKITFDPRTLKNIDNITNSVSKALEGIGTDGINENEELEESGKSKKLEESEEAESEATEPEVVETAAESGGTGLPPGAGALVKKDKANLAKDKPLSGPSEDLIDKGAESKKPWVKPELIDRGMLPNEMRVKSRGDKNLPKDSDIPDEFDKLNADDKKEEMHNRAIEFLQDHGMAYEDLEDRDDSSDPYLVKLAKKQGWNPKDPEEKSQMFESWKSFNVAPATEEHEGVIKDYSEQKDLENLFQKPDTRSEESPLIDKLDLQKMFDKPDTRPEKNKGESDITSQLDIDKHPYDNLSDDDKAYQVMESAQDYLFEKWLEEHPKVQSEKARSRAYDKQRENMEDMDEDEIIKEAKSKGWTLDKDELFKKHREDEDAMSSPGFKKLLDALTDPRNQEPASNFTPEALRKKDIESLENLIQKSDTRSNTKEPDIREPDITTQLDRDKPVPNLITKNSPSDPDNPHVGSSFDDFLEEEGMEGVNDEAARRAEQGDFPEVHEHPDEPPSLGKDLDDAMNNTEGIDEPLPPSAEDLEKQFGDPQKDLKAAKKAFTKYGKAMDKFADKAVEENNKSDNPREDWKVFFEAREQYQKDHPPPENPYDPDEDIKKDLERGFKKAKAGKANPFRDLDEFAGDVQDNAESFLRDKIGDDAVEKMFDDWPKQEKAFWKAAIDGGWTPDISKELNFVQENAQKASLESSFGDSKSEPKEPEGNFPEPEYVPKPHDPDAPWDHNVPPEKEDFSERADRYWGSGMKYSEAIKKARAEWGSPEWNNPMTSYERMEEFQKPAKQIYAQIVTGGKTGKNLPKWDQFDFDRDPNEYSKEIQKKFKIDKPHADQVVRFLEQGMESDPREVFGKPKTETLDPNKLIKLPTNDTQEGKIKPYSKKMPPIEVIRSGGKDYIFDGHHRVESAIRAGKQLKANVYNSQDRKPIPESKKEKE